jgi:hypothetical protein
MELTFEQKKALFEKAKNYGGIHNMTPHAITVAGVTYPPCGIVARIQEEYETEGQFCQVKPGKVIFEKDGQSFPLTGYDCEGRVHIVSAMVFEATKNWICGVWVAPATGHPNVVRNDKGQIVSVPCFRLC